jgi:hypothetical protein
MAILESNIEVYMKMKNPIKNRLQAKSIEKLAETFLGKKNFTWWALLYASLLFIVTGWLPDGIAELCKGEWFESSYKLAASLVILFYIGYELKNALKHEGRIEVISKEPSHAKVIAIFLSPLFRKLKPEDIQKNLTEENLSKEMLNGSEWEMPIKAIEFHSPEVLYILTSKGANGTHNLVPLFKDVIERLFPSLKAIELKHGGIEFEDIKEVFDSIEGLYEEVKKNGFREDDIIVDITGGQKTNSVAGAIATLALGRKFQYVSTRDKRVLSYDVGYFEEE